MRKCTRCKRKNCATNDGPEVNLIRLFQVYPGGTPGMSQLETYVADRIALWLTTPRARLYQSRYTTDKLMKG